MISIFQTDVLLIPQQITAEQSKIVFFYQQAVCQIWVKMCPTEASALTPTGFKEHMLSSKEFRINIKITIHSSSRLKIKFQHSIIFVIFKQTMQ